MRHVNQLYTYTQINVHRKGTMCLMNFVNLMHCGRSIVLYGFVVIYHNNHRAIICKGHVQK